MSKNRIVYIAHPISGDVKNNLNDLLRILRIISTNSHPLYNIHPDRINSAYNFIDVVPCAPYYASLFYLNDSIMSERKIGIENNICLLESMAFKELWLTGDKISHGMKEEINVAKSLGINIINYINKI